MYEIRKKYSRYQKITPCILSQEAIKGDILPNQGNKPIKKTLG